MNHSTYNFLSTFALVLCTAAITTVIFHRLKQPVILGYLLAGLLIGPNFPLLPILADHPTTETLAQLGVILLLFAIGLEFSVRRLTRVGGSVAITAVIEISLTAWLGIGAARLLGWTSHESLFVGAMVAISSTTIIAKTFEDHKVSRKLSDLVFGVLIVEDLVAVLLLAGLGTLGKDTGGGVAALVSTAARLIALLLVWVTAGLVIVPRLMRKLVKMVSPETTVITSVGLCFAFALLANELGYSVALGAFIAGSLIADSGRGEQVAKLVRPVRDVFGAVFFVAVGMLIDPGMIVQHWAAVLVLTVVVMAGKFVSVSSGAFLAGEGSRIAVKAGMSMAQIGEFSFIIISLGLTTGAVREFLYPVAVAVSAITTLATPWLVKASDKVAALIDRKLPKPLQSYATLYGSWTEELKVAPEPVTEQKPVRRLMSWLAVDAGLIIVVVIAAASTYPQLAAWFGSQFGLGPRGALVALAVIALGVATPFMFGLARTARELATMLARAALPANERMDHAAAPRGALVVTFEVAILLLIALPVLAITEPFLPPFGGALVLGGFLVVLAMAGWRSARNLEGHLRAGAELLMEAVKSTLPSEHATTEYRVPTMHGEADRFTTATHMLPGIGSPTRVRIEEGHYGVGRSLAELGLRGRTGATVLGITRKGRGIAAPSKTERLEVSDLLVLVGTKEAIEAAKKVLISGD